MTWQGTFNPLKAVQESMAGKVLVKFVSPKGTELLNGPKEDVWKAGLFIKVFYRSEDTH